MSSVRVHREDTKQLSSDYEGEELGHTQQFKAIADRFESLRDVTRAIKRVGIDTCGLIFGIDYTLSNRLQGQETFDGFSLHDLSRPKANPYQEIICILGETLEPLDDDGIIPAFGFGDQTVKDKGIFPLKKDGSGCDGFTDVLDIYTEVTPTIKLGGPTNFAPIIEEAVRIVKKTKQYHILVIVADGQITSEDETTNAIIAASRFPLSIVVLGVGDGPWKEMEEYDDQLPQRLFDNFQFVDVHKTKAEKKNSQTAIALAALMEIPDQYKEIQRLGLLEKLKG